MKTGPSINAAAPKTLPIAEQTFFEQPALDRAMGVVMALAAEVWVLTDRVRSIEQILERKGVLIGSELDRHQPDSEQARRIDAEREVFINNLMVNLLGEQQSRGTP